VLFLFQRVSYSVRDEECIRRIYVDTQEIMHRQKKLIALLLILPIILLFTGLTIFPFLYMIYMSVHDYDLSKSAEWNFIGLRNYTNIFKDELAIASVNFTALLIFIALPIEMVLGMFIAWLFRDMVGEKIIRSTTLLPMMVPPVVAGIAWKMLFNYNFGPLNYFLSLMGIEKLSWLGSEIYARTGLIIIDVWQWTPFIFLVIYSGLMSIPNELVDAAKVDGANPFKVLIRVEMPILMPLISTVLIIRMIDILKLFDIVFMVTWGGPGHATHSFSYYIYKVGLSYGWNVGYASALSILLLIVVIILVNILMRILRVRELLEL
jgi:multiple sugar transport system permease protein